METAFLIEKWGEDLENGQKNEVKSETRICFYAYKMYKMYKMHNGYKRRILPVFRFWAFLGFLVAESVKRAF